MKYTVEFPERVSDSAFIYYISGKVLKGCDLVIHMNADRELYDERSLKPVKFEEIQFNTQTNYFESKPTEDLENKIKAVERKQVQRGWNCIRLDNEQEFDSAIRHHLAQYQLSVRNRLVLTGRHASLAEGDQFA